MALKEVNQTMFEILILSFVHGNTILRSIKMIEFILKYPKLFISLISWLNTSKVKN